MVPDKCMELFVLLASIAALASASVSAARCSHQKPFTNLVSFGDSYTDNGRLSYYAGNNGHGPPPGVMPAESNVTASGGYTWPQFVANYSGATLYDYAISGATCSNAIISRLLSAINAPFPSVLEDEIPSFQTDVGVPSLYANRTAGNTVYSLWIGTNDLGYGGFLTDSQAPGTTISTFVDCTWRVFDSIYAAGGRRFVLMNQAPLDISPLYQSIGKGGVGDSWYWQNKTLYNTTEYEYKMLEYTTSVNTMFEYGAPFNLLVKNRWPGATFSIFDVHRLLKDISNSPSQFLASPANATGFYKHCNPQDSQVCTTSPEPLSSFLWFDELHPSEGTDTVIARTFIDVANGNSSYGATYGG